MLGITLSLIFIPTAETMAWDVVTGQISSIHKIGNKSRLTVLLDSHSRKIEATSVDSQPKTTGSPAKATTTKSKANSIDLEIDNQDLPPQLKKGDHIRIWSKPDRPQKPWRISKSLGHDPTGVRSRLKGRGRHSGGRGSGHGGGHGGH